MKNEKPLTFNNVLCINITLLKYLAILPFGWASKHAFVEQILGFFQFISHFVHISMFTSFSMKTLNERMFEVDYLCEMMLIVGLYTRHVLLYRRRKEMKNILNRCEELWKGLPEPEKRTVWQYVRKAHYIVYGTLAIYIIANILYVVGSQFTPPPVDLGNETIIRGLPVKFYFDEPLPTPWYEITFVAQVFIIYNALIVAVGIDLFAPFMIMASCGFLRVINDRLLSISKYQLAQFTKTEDSINEESDAPNRDIGEELIACVQFHQTVLEFCKRIINATTVIFTIQLICTAYNTSLAGIQLIGNDPDRFKFIFVILSCLIQVFTIQWAADYLVEEGGALANAAYFGPQKNRKENTLVLMIMVKSQKPVRLIAGGMLKLSLANFSAMIASAYSFFTILRTLNV